jgi:transcriptional regulator with XRE-family HTH domain
MDNYIRNNRIGEALNLRGMRQVELCEKTGIAKASINGWIKQKWQPKQKPLALMAKALDVSEMWLAGYDAPMERPLEQIKNDELAQLITNIRKDDNLKNLFVNINNLTTEQRNTIELMVNQLLQIN